MKSQKFEMLWFKSSDQHFTFERAIIFYVIKIAK